MMRPSSLVAILAVAVLNSSANASEESLAEPIPGSAGKTVYADDSTLPYFSPKVDLSALRFVFSGESRLYVELSYDGWMLYEDFKLSFPDFDENELPGIFADFLSLPQQRFVFENIPDGLGDRYCVLFPDSLRCRLLTLSGVTLRPTFEGGFWGFMGILDGEFSDLPDRGPVAIAFKSGRKGKAKKLGNQVIDEAKRTQIAQYLSSLRAEGKLKPVYRPEVTEFLRRVDAGEVKIVDEAKATPYLRHLRGEGKLEVVDGRRIFLQYPDVTGVIARVDIEKRRFLFCLLEEGDTFRVVPFPKDFSYSYSAPEGSIVIHDPDGQTDISVRHGEVVILPDLDGNGGNELLLRAPVEALFSIVRDHSSWQPRYVIEVVRMF
jgi:hypothetical protein